MPELRKDPISDRWVVISTERGRRPSDFGSIGVGAESAEVKSCAFCEGNEGKTPPEIIAWRKAATSPNTAGWDVRVIPNKFPALIIEGEVNRTGMGIYDMMSGIGALEESGWEWGMGGRFPAVSLWFPTPRGHKRRETSSWLGPARQTRHESESRCRWARRTR